MQLKYEIEIESLVDCISIRIMYLKIGCQYLSKRTYLICNLLRIEWRLKNELSVEIQNWMNS